MNVLITVLLIVVALAIILSILARLPPRRLTLDRRKPSKAFHGFILFGKDGSYVEFDEKSTGDFFLFEKKYGKNDDWLINVSVRSMNMPPLFLEGFQSSLAMLRGRFEVVKIIKKSSDQVRFCLAGGGLKDHYALESVVRLIARGLKHSQNYKYRVEFKGPKDYDAVDRYFEAEKKKWKGEDS